MGKVNSHNTGKVWGSPGKVWGSPNISNLWFLKYLGLNRNPYNFQNIGKVNLLSTGKVWGNTEISHIFRYLANLEFVRTHTIPNAWECTNYHRMEISCGKPYHFQTVGFWEN